ncbi:MAG: isoamylase early set domain-containing protein [Victivallales bacterium]
MKLLPAVSGRRVRFKLSAEPGSQVFVAGMFNNWNPTANPLKDSLDSGHYKAVFSVPAGTQEYKFIVNGIWFVDPGCAGLAPNNYGSQNSVLDVPCFKTGLVECGCRTGGQVSDPPGAGGLPFQKQEGRIMKSSHFKQFGTLRRSIRRDQIAGAGFAVALVILFILVLMGRI